jgi:hypothetical protein
MCKIQFLDTAHSTFELLAAGAEPVIRYAKVLSTRPGNRAH